ncbi:hypothetical protein WDZ16_13510 [Pseudokineococcus marinus]|uniref:UVR domain-containing protein n=2 Tax=Pseudokineococcus TaxID=1156392 RepID=A0A849BXU5_9ACTN|nr:hypothetical protein [Pseudokineococcus marinus]NNH24256.1 hypothetical protein [Pseudokineococcus marinus]
MSGPEGRPGSPEQSRGPERSEQSQEPEQTQESEQPAPEDQAAADDVGSGLPAGAGRARDLVRGRRRAARSPDPGGRRHHMGAVPERMPVLRPDGSRGTTRTSVVQLTAATAHRLEALEAELDAEMRALAAEGRYEEAAWSRDELAAVRGERARRAGR